MKSQIKKSRTMFIHPPGTETCILFLLSTEQPDLGMLAEARELAKRLGPGWLVKISEDEQHSFQEEK